MVKKQFKARLLSYTYNKKQLQQEYGPAMTDLADALRRGDFPSHAGKGRVGPKKYGINP
jgi:hypothetical protein